MKYSNLQAFQKHLEGSFPHHFAEVYALLSKEDFERKQALQMLLHYLLKDQPPNALAVQTFEAQNLSSQQILDELNSFPLFAKKRVLIVHQADQLDKKICIGLEQYLSRPDRSVHLVLTAASLPLSSNFYKKIEKVGIVFEAVEEKPWEKEKAVQQWILAKVAQAKKQIDPQVCQFLVRQMGTDKALLYQELEKLFCYLGERAMITVNDIQAVCNRSNGETIWQLGEAVFRRDATTALRVSKALLLEGAPFLGLLRQIRTQFQTEFQISTLLHQGKGASEVTQQFPYMKGAILERHLQLAQNYGLTRFRKGLQLVDEIDLQARNGGNADILNEQLFIKLTLT